jgi:hypothetical protein
MNSAKKDFVKSPPRWKQIRERLQMTSEHMKELAARFTEEGGDHLTEDDKNLVASAYAGHIAEVTNSMKISLISRSRDRVVDDIEEIHKVIEILDCL